MLLESCYCWYWAMVLDFRKLKKKERDSSFTYRHFSQFRELDFSVQGYLEKPLYTFLPSKSASAPRATVEEGWFGIEETPVPAWILNFCVWWALMDSLHLGLYCLCLLDLTFIKKKRKRNERNEDAWVGSLCKPNQKCQNVLARVTTV